MKEEKDDLVKSISNEELDSIVTDALNNNCDIYTINSKQVIIDNNDSELSYLYDSEDYLISTIDSIILSEIHNNINYKNILLIYKSNDGINVRRYAINDKNNNNKNHSLIICDEEHLINIFKKELYKVGYIQTSIDSNKRMILKK